MSPADIKVRAFGSYCTRPLDKSVAGCNDAFHLLKFVKAIKGEPFRGHAYIPVEAERHKLEESTVDDVFDWFAKRAAGAFMKGQPYLFVPIPSSSATTKEQARECRPTELAKALTRLAPQRKWSALLWWEEARGPAHRSRDKKLRDPSKLFENLAVADRLTDFVRRTPIVLVDDVCTTGSHFQAAEAKLRQAGLKVIGGLCAARAVQEQPQEAFKEVVDFFPKLDLDDDEIPFF